MGWGIVDTTLYEKCVLTWLDMGLSPQNTQRPQQDSNPRPIG